MSIIAANKTSHVTTTEYDIKLDVIKNMIAADLGVDPKHVELIWNIDGGYDDRYSSTPTLRSLKVRVVTR